MNRANRRRKILAQGVQRTEGSWFARRRDRADSDLHQASHSQRAESDELEEALCAASAQSPVKNALPERLLPDISSLNASGSRPAVAALLPANFKFARLILMLDQFLHGADSREERQIAAPLDRI